MNISYAARTPDEKSPSEAASKKADIKTNDVTDGSGSETKHEILTQSKSSTLEGWQNYGIGSLAWFR